MTDPTLFIVWTRPSGRGRWRKLGTADSWREACDLVDASGLGSGDYWFNQIVPAAAAEPVAAGRVEPADLFAEVA